MEKVKRKGSRIQGEVGIEGASRGRARKEGTENEDGGQEDVVGTWPIHISLQGRSRADVSSGPSGRPGTPPRDRGGRQGNSRTVAPSQRREMRAAQHRSSVDRISACVGGTGRRKCGSRGHAAMRAVTTAAAPPPVQSGLTCAVASVDPPLDRSTNHPLSSDACALPLPLLLQSMIYHPSTGRSVERSNR